MKNPLEKVRLEIDSLDQELIRLFKKRQGLVHRVISIKQKHNLPIFQPQREKEMYAKLLQLEKKHSLPKNFLVKVWKVLIAESRVLQKKLRVSR